MDRALTKTVCDRASERCEYCLMPGAYDPSPFQIDHIIAVKHGGATEQGNLALACYTFNLHKGPNVAGVSPETNEIIRLFHPRNDVWSDHFCWNGPEPHGITEIGRATIAVLAINRAHRVQRPRTDSMNQKTIFSSERDLTDIARKSSESVREVRSLPNTIGGPSRAVRQVVVESNRALENTARDSCRNQRRLT